MKKIQLAQVKPYGAPKHFNMVALKLHGKEETGSQKFWVGLSHFLPEGGAEYDESRDLHGFLRTAQPGRGFGSRQQQLGQYSGQRLQEAAGGIF